MSQRAPTAQPPLADGAPVAPATVGESHRSRADIAVALVSSRQTRVADVQATWVVRWQRRRMTNEMLTALTEPIPLGAVRLVVVVLSEFRLDGCGHRSGRGAR